MQEALASEISWWYLLLFFFRCPRSKLSACWWRSCTNMVSGISTKTTLKIFTASSTSWSVCCRFGLWVFVKGIVHQKVKSCWIFTHPQAIQDVDEFVSSSEQLWGNLALLAHNMDPLQMSPNLFRWRNKLIYILDGLRVSKYSANFHFLVNYSFKRVHRTQAASQMTHYILCTYKLCTYKLCTYSLCTQPCILIKTATVECMKCPRSTLFFG